MDLTIAMMRVMRSEFKKLDSKDPTKLEKSVFYQGVRENEILKIFGKKVVFSKMKGKNIIPEVDGFYHVTKQILVASDLLKNTAAAEHLNSHF